jgi:hypothetical protein
LVSLYDPDRVTPADGLYLPEEDYNGGDDESKHYDAHDSNDNRQMIGADNICNIIPSYETLSCNFSDARITRKAQQFIDYHTFTY